MKPETVDQIIGRVRKVMGDAVCGPLVVAADVVALSSSWEAYRPEVGDIPINDYLRRNLGNGKTVGYFQKRANAVKALGEHIRRSWHHESAVWVFQNFTGAEREKARTAVDREWAARNKVPLTPSETVRVVDAALGAARVPRHKSCAKCDAYRKRIAELEAMLAPQSGVELNAAE